MKRMQFGWKKFYKDKSGLSGFDSNDAGKETAEIEQLS